MAADIAVMLDGDLSERARGGDREAFAELYRREAPVAWRLALAVTRAPAPAGRVVAAAFAKVLAGPAPTGRPIPVRHQLLAAIRAVALEEATTSSSAAPEPRDELALQAFVSLPERYRSILWLTEGEGYEPSAAAAVLGLSVDATEALIPRARAGLRERFALANLAGTADPECERAATRLDAYARDDISAREGARVRRHLDKCASCRDRLAELDDLTPRLRRSALPVPAGLAPRAEDAWRSALVTATGPLHLTLPNGRHVPAWAERAVAGAAAAVITLGITGAVIAGGRGKPRDDQLVRQAAAAGTAGSADGESALGLDDLSLVLPEGTPVPSIAGVPGTASQRGTARTSAGSRTEQARSISTTTTTEPTPAPAGPGSTTSTTTPGSTTTSPPTTESPSGDGPSPAPSTPDTTVPAPVEPVTEPLAPITEPLQPVLDVVDGAVGTVVDLLDPVLGGGAGGLLGG